MRRLELMSSENEKFKGQINEKSTILVFIFIGQKLKLKLKYNYKIKAEMKDTITNINFERENLK